MYVVCSDTSSTCYHEGAHFTYAALSTCAHYLKHTNPKRGNQQSAAVKERSATGSRDIDEEDLKSTESSEGKQRLDGDKAIAGDTTTKNT